VFTARYGLDLYIRIIHVNVRLERAKMLGVTLHLPTVLYCQTERWSRQSDKYSLRPLGNAIYWPICHVSRSWESGIPFIRNQIYSRGKQIYKNIGASSKFLAPEW
jgi:hypothetical protein